MSGGGLVCAPVIVLTLPIGLLTGIGAWLSPRGLLFSFVLFVAAVIATILFPAALGHRFIALGPLLFTKFTFALGTSLTRLC